MCVLAGPPLLCSGVGTVRLAGVVVVAHLLHVVVKISATNKYVITSPNRHHHLLLVLSSWGPISLRAPLSYATSAVSIHCEPSLTKHSPWNCFPTRRLLFVIAIKI